MRKTSMEKVAGYKKTIADLEKEIARIANPHRTVLKRLHTRIKAICEHPNLEYYEPYHTGGCGIYHRYGGYSTCPDCHGFWDHIKGMYPRNWYDKNAPYYERIFHK